MLSGVARARVIADIQNAVGQRKAAKGSLA